MRAKRAKEAEKDKHCIHSPATVFSFFLSGTEAEVR